MPIEETVILLACLKAPQHGYTIERQIIADTTGQVYIPASSTYRLLVKLTKQGFLDVSMTPGTRLKQYRTTHKGKVRLEYQAAIYQKLHRTIVERLRA